MQTSTFISNWSERLLQAERSRTPVKPLTNEWPDISLTEAYLIQLEQINQKVNQGARIVGKKIGLTSKVMQEMFGVNQPDYGHLLDTMAIVDGQSVSLEEFIAPKLEAEIAFVLKKELKGPHVTYADVIEATDYIVPAFEIIDSRIEDWAIQFEDTVADNGSSARFILGGKPTPLRDVDLVHLGMVIDKNGEQIDTACAASVLGSPIKAVVWLANALSQFDISLQKGEVILSGAITKALEVKNGDRFTAHFAHIGSVSVHFQSEVTV